MPKGNTSMPPNKSLYPIVFHGFRSMGNAHNAFLVLCTLFVSKYTKDTHRNSIFANHFFNTSNHHAKDFSLSINPHDEHMHTVVLQAGETSLQTKFVMP